MHAPQLSLAEALGVEAEHFVDCVRTGREPITGGEAGLRVVRVLEAAAQSLAERGRVVDL
jgi:predicted dehydrogenase